jgi:alkylation response protein AidB-like acyl-CoA dehydrogenase
MTSTTIQQSMPSFELDDDHRELSEVCRAFVEREVMPLVPSAERDGAFPVELWPKLAAAGLLGLGHPEEHGGTGGGVLALAILSEALAHASGGVAITPLVSAYMAAPHLARLGTPEQRRRFLEPVLRGEAVAAIAVTEPGAGSDVAGIRSQARPDGEDWLLSGSKMFITNAGLADVLIVAARTVDGGSTPWTAGSRADLPPAGSTLWPRTSGVLPVRTVRRGRRLHAGVLRLGGNGGANASMFLASPRIAAKATGEIVTLEEMGGARMHCTVSGCGDELFPDDAAAIAGARAFLGYLPQHYDERPQRGVPEQPESSDWDGVLPSSHRTSYDIHEVIRRVIDAGSLLEIKALWAAEMLVVHGAKMIAAMSSAEVPRFCVVLRKAYAAGYYAMSSPGFAPRATIALAGAQIGAMAAEAAVNAVWSNTIEELEDEQEREAFISERRTKIDEELDAIRVASELMIEAVVDPADLRAELCARLAAADGWRRSPPHRHHGAFPV